MPGIFISYRREDSAGSAGRLYADVKRRFEREQVFIDVAGISIGQDFRKAIERHVGACDVLLVVIGKEWLRVSNAAGQPRLRDPKDFVRLELIAALTRDVAVVPVLVDGATMPRPEELPAEFEALGWRNGMELRHTRWDDDVNHLAHALEKLLHRDGRTATASANPPTDRPLSRDQAVGVQHQPPAPGAGRPWFALIATAVVLIVALVGVGLFRSKGRASKVPNLVGLNESAVRNAIKQAGLSLGEVKARTSSEAQGTVVAQEPPAGTEVRPGRPVNLVVAAPKTGEATVDSPSPAPLARMEIQRFEARKPIKGKGATLLCWSVLNGLGARIEPDVGNVDPSKPENACRGIRPKAETTYTLTATGPGGQTESRQVTVTPQH